FLAAYTLSRALTDNLGYYGSGGVAAEGAYWQNVYDRHGDYGPSFFDARHIFSLGGSYELPVGRKKAWGNGWSKPLDLVLGGWNANYIVSMHSGFPVTFNSTDRSGGQLARGTSRPNRYK